MSNCVTDPNFVAIGQTVAEISRFLDLTRWRPPTSWILKILNFNGRNGQKVELRHRAKLSSKSLVLRPSCDNFSLFQDGGRRHLGFWKFQFLRPERPRGSNYVTVPNSVAIGQTITEISLFLDFLRWRPPPSGILKK